MTAMLSQPCDPEVRDLWLAVADALAVKPRMRPSEWAESNVVLDSGQAARAGAFRCDWKPWTRDLHDALYDNPEKRGLIGMKPAQVGWSQATINLLLYLAEHEPGPMLYVTDTKDKARNFGDDYMMPTIRRSPRLSAMFDDPGDDRSILKLHKPFRGGVIDLHGAGSDTGMTSVGRRWLVLDEYELSSTNYLHKRGGDLLRAANERLTTYRDIGALLAYGHPRYEGEDIDRLYATISDQRRWVFDCPHCSGVVEPCWERVELARLDGPEARPDPESARFLCPHCREEITDAQRARATWPARLREGGTGRFESELPAAEAAKREFVGLKLNRLADPEVTVRELARGHAACRTEEALLEWFNKGLGEPRKKSRSVVTIETIRGVVQTMAPIVVPGGDLGVRFVTGGGDVQAPRHHPTLYLAAVAWAADGMAYVVSLERVSGFTAESAWARGAGVQVQGGGAMGLRLVTLDAGWETGQVIGACREPTVYSAADSGVVQHLPARYVPTLNEDNPAVMAPERKRRNPLRPELGLIDYFYLYRHAWVDRMLKRIMEGRLKVLCPVPEGFEAHLMSNVMRPVPKRHGMDRQREEWVKPDEFRDDWLQALVYAEVGAALVLGLDTIHAVSAMPEAAPPPAADDRSGYMERFRQRGSWWNR